MALLDIPAGCTGKVQPVDVGIARPFKSRLRNLWGDWMLTQDDDFPDTPERMDVSAWIHRSWDAMPVHIVQNAWRKTDYELVRNN